MKLLKNQEVQLFFWGMIYVNGPEDRFSAAAAPDPIRQEIYGHIKKFLDLGGTQKTD